MDHNLHTLIATHLLRTGMYQQVWSFPGNILANAVKIFPGLNQVPITIQPSAADYHELNRVKGPQWTCGRIREIAWHQYRYPISLYLVQKYLIPHKAAKWLETAVYQGHLPVVVYLIELNLVDYALYGDGVVSLAYISLAQNHSHILEYLLKTTVIEQCGDNPVYLVEMAICHQRPLIAISVIRHYRQLRQVDRLLLLAVTHNETQVVKELVAIGARPDHQCISRAITNNNIDIANCLLLNGISFNDGDRRSLIDLAISRSSPAMVKQLIHCGLMPSRYHHEILLSNAIEYSSLEMVKVLYIAFQPQHIHWAQLALNLSASLGRLELVRFFCLHESVTRQDLIKTISGQVHNQPVTDLLQKMIQVK